MRFASRWTAISSVFVACFTVLLGTAVWWFLGYALPSALQPPSTKWEMEIRSALQKHFACAKEGIRFKIIIDEQVKQENQEIGRIAESLTKLFFSAPELINAYSVTEHFRLEDERQVFNVYCFPISSDSQNVQTVDEFSVCFGLSQDGYVKTVTVKPFGMTEGISGTDFVLMKFETFENLRGCLLPTTGVVELYSSSGVSKSKLRYTAKVRIAYE